MTGPYGFVVGHASGYTRHECRACGCRFLVRLDRPFWLPAWSNPVAYIEAHLEKMTWREGIDKPCPACRRPSARHLGRKWRDWDGLVGGCALAFALVLTAFGFDRTLMDPNHLAYVAVAGLAAILAAQCAIGFVYPAGTRRGTPEDQPTHILDRQEWAAPRRPRSPARWVSYLATILAAVWASIPVQHRVSAEARTNPDTRPTIVAPGDRVKVYFAAIESLNGDWSGQDLTVKIHNWPEGVPLDAVGFGARTPPDLADRRDPAKERTFKNATPWLEFRVPGEEWLAGADLDVEASMVISYSAPTRGWGVAPRREAVRTRLRIRLSDPRDVRSFQTVQLICMLAASATLAAGVVLRFWADLRHSRLPPPSVVVQSWTPR